MSSIALWALGYVAIAAFAAGLVMMPEWRSSVLRAARIGSRWMQSTAKVPVRKTSSAAAGGWRTLRSVPIAIARMRPVHWLIAACAVLALGLPSVLALKFGTDRWLGDYEATSNRAVDPHIAALLQGEQLVPPAPLPPEVFSTKEVLQSRPDVQYASREWNALDPDFRQRLLLVFSIMKEQHGYEMALIEGYRSPERQDQLMQKGGHVTHAGAFQSYHQFGLAADCAFYRNGKIVISEKDAWARKGYDLYGEVAESVGLTWGGRWKSIVDLGHVELRRPEVKARHRAAEAARRNNP